MPVNWFIRLRLEIMFNSKQMLRCSERHGACYTDNSLTSNIYEGTGSFHRRDGITSSMLPLGTVT